MSAPAITIRSTAPIEEAAMLMREQSLGCLPVVLGEAILGIVTRGDLRRAGLSYEEALGGHVCVACGERHGLGRDGQQEVLFCMDCMERAHVGDSDDEDELGIGD